MAKFTVAEITNAVHGVFVQGDPDQVIEGIATDSRKIAAGELFLALKGERFNGHDFLEAAIQAGAGAMMIMDETPTFPGVAIIKVPDTLIAFGEIARFHRERFAIPVIGITGSNGKTTTKDLVASILETELSIVKTEANYNNEIGLPMTLLNISKKTQAVVVEMGMRGTGQIRKLAQIANPTAGIITNVGLTHLELLGTQENIAKAKAELVESLPRNGLAVLNGDDPFVRKMQSLTRAITVLYGIDSPNLNYQAIDIRTNDTGSFFKVQLNDGCLELFIPIPGKHNILNALAAIAIAKELGISNKAIQAGLAEPSITGKRLNITEQNGYRIIDDTYNASPTSVKAALDVLNSVASKRKIAILADMLELGPRAGEIHYEIGQYAKKIGTQHLFAFGELAAEYARGFNGISEGSAEYFSSKIALINRVKEYLQPGDVILVKGSRGMKMEEVVTALSAEGVEN